MNEHTSNGVVRQPLREIGRRNAIDFNAVNQAVLPHARALCERLLPGGRCLGHEYVVRNPRRHDRTPGSFRINLESGKWADFATGDHGGDLISLVAFLLDVRQSEAARRLNSMLHLACVRP